MLAEGVKQSDWKPTDLAVTDTVATIKLSKDAQ